MKLRVTALAVAVAFPMLAHAQSTAQLQSEIDALKAQIKELQDLVKGRSQATATPLPAAAAPTPVVVEAPPAVDLEEFNRIKTKVEAMEDQQAANGTKSLRISGGIDPVYIFNEAKNTSSFSFGNNFANTGVDTSSMYSYDNSYYGMAYIDFQKEMEGGTKLRLTLAPTKSVASGITGSIIQEASASIPLIDAQTRLMVGQMGDVSGYEPTLNTYSGANNITSNQLYPGYAEYFVTKNLLFDFTAANFYTGIGLDLVRGPWEYKFWLANMNAARNDLALTSSDNAGLQAPAFIYNATYSQDEFWGFEFTGYAAQLANSTTGVRGRMDQFEIDGNYTRGDFNGNLQLTLGQMANGAFNGQDANWWGVSALVSEKMGARWILAGRLDYLNNERNGGGIYTVGSNLGSLANPAYNGSSALGDVINGFGPGDPNDPSYDPNKGANRYALTLAATYRLNANVALRSEYRRDFATTSAFYNFGTGAFQNTNTTLAFQAVVNF